VIDYLAAYSRVLAGRDRPFDEAAMRQFVRRDLERTRNAASLQNHDVIPNNGTSHQSLGSIAAPTVVLHGTADPMFPLPHGEALAEEIPGATFVALTGAGHGVDRADWGTIAGAIVGCTASGV
jgi:pimeloyl-ACP methyl ester carboxylesterase